MTRKQRIHPGAWWLWALGLAAGATATTNPLILALILTVVAVVVALRRPEGSPSGFRFYVVLALIIIGFRVLFRAVFGAGLGTHVLVNLPTVSLPSWAAGITVGGPVTAESVLAALYDGMRLATIVVCVGAANTLADPRGLLRSLPRALYDVGTAVALALSLAPQLVDSIGRVRRARHLRGDSPRWWQASSLIAPVLEDAMQQALSTAAAMDSRGYGRTPERGAHRWSLAATLTGLGGLVVGMFGLVGGGLGMGQSFTALGIGVVASTLGFYLSGADVGRTVYRPLRFGFEGWAIALSGLTSAAVMWAMTWWDPGAMSPSVQPLGWPPLPVLAANGVVIAVVAGVVSSTPGLSRLRIAEKPAS